MQAELCTLGIPREPWDFVQRAVQAGHPRSLAIHLSGDVKEMLKQNFADEPYKIIKERATFLKQWTVRCKELEAQEQELHCSLEPHMREVLSGNNAQKAFQVHGCSAGHGKGVKQKHCETGSGGPG